MVICGHPRSGTTLLNRICDEHPDIKMTFEFGNFQFIGISYSKYMKKIFKRWRIKRRSTVLWHYQDLSKNRLYSDLFIIRYLFKIYKNNTGIVDLSAIEQALYSIFPEVSIVGDKFPGYFRNLDQFSKLDGLYRLVIYRDCRDVVRSVLDECRTSWRNKKFAERLNSPRKAAINWVNAIEAMERNNDKIFKIRYEDFVQNSDNVFSGLGEWLDIDPSGFKSNIIRDTSIGKYKKELSGKDLETIIEIAGPAMKRCGYL